MARSAWGSGKSATARVITGLLKPSRGEFPIGGRAQPPDCRARRRDQPATVKAIADKVAAMQNCRVAEKCPKAEMFRPPHEPYAALLLSSVPEMDPDGLTRLLGERGVGAVVRMARDLAASWIVSSGL